mmetsp:Transcript_102956/g.300396  ORF Transcript_102956/g.300396 Transcript_102956/m.300396 type:complete len:239 (+) Transcript_102956:1101-1817(+)
MGPRRFLERRHHSRVHGGRGRDLVQAASPWNDVASPVGFDCGGVGLLSLMSVLVTKENVGGHCWKGEPGRWADCPASVGLSGTGRGLAKPLNVGKRGPDCRSLCLGGPLREFDDAVPHRRNHRDKYLQSARMSWPRRRQRHCILLWYPGRQRPRRPVLPQRRQRRPRPALQLRGRRPPGPQRPGGGPPGGGAARGGAAGPRGRGLGQRHRVERPGAALAAEGIRLCRGCLRDVPYDLG